MKLIIDIPEEDYETMKHNIAVDNPLCPLSQKDMVATIANGIPLPKGHGRLIDADALNRKNVNCANVPMNFIDTAPTIIEADITESEKTNGK